MNSRLVLKAADLECALTENDQRGIAGMNECRSEASASFKAISACESHSSLAKNETDRVIRLGRYPGLSPNSAMCALGTTSSFTPLEYDTAGGRLREHPGFVVPFSGADEVERTVLGR